MSARGRVFRNRGPARAGFAALTTFAAFSSCASAAALRPSLLHSSNRNPKPSNAAASAVREEKVASAVPDGAATAPEPAVSNRQKEEKQGSEVSTRATSSDSPRARIRRERGKKNLKTTR